jgi:hypothetical protein
MIDGQLHASEGKSLINFSQTLPPENSDMAVQVLRYPYNFGFLTLAHPLEEHKLERGPARPHAGSVARARPRLRLRRQPGPAHVGEETGVPGKFCPVRDIRNWHERSLYGTRQKVST